MSSDIESKNQPLLSQTGLTPDQALHQAGDSNWYQVRTTLLFAMQWTIIAFILQGQPFLFLSPKFICTDSSKHAYICEEKEACEAPIRILDPSSPESLSVRFSLYCERQYLKALCQTLFFVASNFSTLVFSFMADFKGRKFTILLLYIMGAIPLLIAGFSTNWTMFMCFLIFAGIGINPYSALCFVLLSESAGEKYRQLSSVGLLITWGIGQILFIPIALYFPDWQTLLIYWIALPLIAQIVTYMWIYESPKFLIMKQKFNEARKVLAKIAKVNGKTLGDFQFEEEKKIEDNNKKKTHDRNHTNGTGIINREVLDGNMLQSTKSTDLNSQKSLDVDPSKRIYTYMDLFRYKSQLRITLILSFAYFAIYVAYYGGIFALDSLGGNIYFSALMVNSAELIAYLFASPIIRFLPRRFAFPCCLLTLSLSCLLFLTVESYTLIIAFAMLTKFAAAIAFSIIYVYTAELYPTTVRSLGVGMNNFIGKFGCAVAPLLITLFKFNLNIHPMVSFGIIGFFAGIAVIFLKETHKKALLDEIPEIMEKKLIKEKDEKLCKEESTQEEEKEGFFFSLPSNEGTFN